MMESERIDLHLPHSWQSCTAQELESLVQAQRMIQLYPMSWNQESNSVKNTPWKVECFLRLTGLEVMEGPKPEVSVEEQYLVVRHTRQKRKKWGWLPWVRNDNNEPFVLYLWQIHYWIKENMAWLDTPPLIVRFPYPTWHWRWKRFKGPGIRLSEWTWTQYRLAQDYLQYYTKIAENVEKQLQQNIRHDERKKLMQQLRTAKGLFLATIYNRKVRTIDTENMRHKHDYTYVSNQHSENCRAFQNYPEIQFQVVLLWWQSMMQYLHRTYPKCFGDSNKKSPKKPADPMQIYSRLTAIMEKYMHIDERQLGRETFANVLQHLNDLVIKNETIDRMNKKAKKKG